MLSNVIYLGHSTPTATAIIRDENEDMGFTRAKGWRGVIGKLNLSRPSDRARRILDLNNHAIRAAGYVAKRKGGVATNGLRKVVTLRTINI
jgi:hypothetical protein